LSSDKGCEIVSDGLEEVVVKCRSVVKDGMWDKEEDEI
jgi:hypothetical protein